MQSKRRMRYPSCAEDMQGARKREGECAYFPRPLASSWQPTQHYQLTVALASGWCRRRPGFIGNIAPVERALKVDFLDRLVGIPFCVRQRFP